MALLGKILAGMRKVARGVAGKFSTAGNRAINKAARRVGHFLRGPRSVARGSPAAFRTERTPPAMRRAPSRAAGSVYFAKIKGAAQGFRRVKHKKGGGRAAAAATSAPRRRKGFGPKGQILGAKALSGPAVSEKSDTGAKATGLTAVQAARKLKRRAAGTFLS